MRDCNGGNEGSDKSDKWGWDIPGPGIKSMFPALASRFFTTEPAGTGEALGLCSSKRGNVPLSVVSDPV